MVGDEVTVLYVDKSHGTLNTPERFKDYVVIGNRHRQPENWESPDVDTKYYLVQPIDGYSDEEATSRMLSGGGRIREEHLYPNWDSWVLRRGFLRGELEEEPNEIARTLSKARKHGVGTRFPKAAIKANPQRFRKYTRDKYLKEQQEISPELEVGDKILLVGVDREVENNAIKYHIPPPELRPEKFTPYVVVDKESNGSESKYPFRYTLIPEDKLEKWERYEALHNNPLYHKKIGVKLLFPWVHDWIIKKSKINEHNQPGLNPELKVDDIVRVIDVDGEHGRMPKRFETYIVVKVGKTYPLMAMRNRGYHNEYYDIRPYPDSSTQFSELDVKSLYRGDTWIYANVPMANKVDRKTISEQDEPGFDEFSDAELEKRRTYDDFSDDEKAEIDQERIDTTPFTPLEIRILKTLHKNFDRSELQTLSTDTPEAYGNLDKKFWNVMKLFGIEETHTEQNTRESRYAKWALDNWNEEGDYNIENPIKVPLKWYDVDREESGSQVEYKIGDAEVLGFDEDNAGDRADYDFYAWGGEMETNDYGDYESYDSSITNSEFIRMDESIKSQTGGIEAQDLLFNFWKKVGPTMETDKLKLIGFDMNDTQDMNTVMMNLVEYYGDEEIVEIITEMLEGIQGWEYEYVVTSIDFSDLINPDITSPATIMIDVMVNGDQEIPLTTADDGVIDITLWEVNERAQKEWKGGGPGPYDNTYEDVREQVLSDISILLKNVPVEPMLDYVDFSGPDEKIDDYVGTPEVITESKIDDLVWSEKPTQKHKKRMEKEFGKFEGFPINDFMDTNPPKNGSEESMDELMLLDSLPVIDEFVGTTDDIFPHFEKYFKEKGLEFPEEELKDIVKDTSPIILKLKYHYNRPRPQQLANAKKLKFHQEPLASSKTPAYPSGHATQGRLIAKILADKFPKHKSEINKLGNEIGTGRLVAKVHYPSDDLFGKELGDALYRFIQNKEIIKEENDIIIKDNNHQHNYKDYDKFINYVVDELNIENTPTIYVEKEPSSEYTGGTYRYKGGSERIKVRSKGRSLADILRSLAHELVHHKQKENGDFKNKEVIKDIPEVGGHIEDEANAIAGRLIKKYGKQNQDLYEQVMVDTGDMLKSDVFKFLSNRFVLTPTEYSEIKDNNGNYYRIIDMNTPDEPVNLSDLIEPVIEFVGYGLKSGTFKEEDTQKGIEAITNWLSLAMNQYKEPIN